MTKSCSKKGQCKYDYGAKMRLIFCNRKIFLLPKCLYGIKHVIEYIVINGGKKYFGDTGICLNDKRKLMA